MGFFIVFEGGEGNGKSTQIKLITKALEQKGFSVFNAREPGGPEISEKVRELVMNPKYKGKIGARTEMFLYMVARAQHTEEWIISKLKEYDFYISDRYALSSVGYQGYGRGLLKEVKQCNEIATQGIVPDLTIILDISAKKGLEKMSTDEFGEKDRLEQEPLNFHEQVNQGFLQEAKLDPDRMKVIPYLENQPEQMHQQILSHVLKLVEKNN
ncbi:dTMP kinase [Candidatus Woesearchaeota archaeon]|nr:dTMP kinase [Candidatus Woesearchaeota archaeon]